MTWSTPAPTPPSGLPAATALIRPGRLTLGEVVGGAWRVYRARIGLFVRLLLMPFLILFAASIVFVAIAVALVAANFRDPEKMLPGLIVVTIVFYIAMLVLSLLFYVYQGRSVIAAVDLATGRVSPTAANLAARTSGMLGRLIMLVLLTLAVGLVVGLVLVFTMVPIALASSGRDTGAAAGGIGVLLVVALYVALFWLSVKVIYIIPVMAEEAKDAWPAVRRSFELTRGAFWRTFGYQIVLALIAVGVMLIPYLIMAVSLAASVNSRGQVSGAGVFGSIIGTLALYALLLLFVPYQYIFVALMYLSRRQEVDSPGTAATGLTGGTGYPSSSPYPYPPEPGI